jgi:hypothetical protein
MSEYKFSDIEVFSATNAALADYQDRFGVVPDVNIKENYDLVKAGISELVSVRNKVDKKRLELTKPLRERVKDINDEGTRIMDALSEVEAPMKAAKKEFDEREAKLKSERIAKLQKRVDDILIIPANSKGLSSKELEGVIESVENIDTSESFFDLTAEATEARDKVLNELSVMLSGQIIYEQQIEARKKAEAEAERLKRESWINDQITRIKLMPADAIDMDSKGIDSLVTQLNEIFITSENFGAREEEAQSIKIETASKLGRMLAAKKIEEQKQLEVENVTRDKEVMESIDQDIKDKQTSAGGHCVGLDRPKQESLEGQVLVSVEKEGCDNSYLKSDCLNIQAYLRRIQAISQPEVSTEKGKELLGLIDSQVIARIIELDEILSGNGE